MPPAPNPRLKSNSACLECRRRKIKCDGARPQCQTCLKRHKECIFPDSIDPASARPAEPRPSYSNPAPAPPTSNPAGESQQLPLALEGGPGIAYPQLQFASHLPTSLTFANSSPYPTSLQPILPQPPPQPPAHEQLPPSSSLATDHLPQATGNPPQALEPTNGSSRDLNIDPALFETEPQEFAGFQAFQGRSVDHSGVAAESVTMDLEAGDDFLAEFGLDNLSGENLGAGILVEDLVDHDETDSQAKRRLKITDLYMLGGEDPPTPKISSPLSEEQRGAMVYLFTHEYARGIDQIFETDWYTRKGLDRLLADSRLCEMFAGMVELFEHTTSDKYDTMRMLPMTESRMVWLLMEMARLPNAPRQESSSSSSASTPALTPQGNGYHEQLAILAARLTVFEALLTGRTLDNNPLSAFSTGPLSATVLNNFKIPIPQNYNSIAGFDNNRYRQRVFWHTLGGFVSISSTEQPSSAAAALTRMRQFLDQNENRDVLYSIAFVRHAYVFGAGSGAMLDQNDRARLAKAKKFVEDEASMGTTQVIQRVCGMAVRGWTFLKNGDYLA